MLDISASTPSEAVLLMIMLITSTAMFAYIINGI